MLHTKSFNYLATFSMYSILSIILNIMYSGTFYSQDSCITNSNFFEMLGVKLLKFRTSEFYFDFFEICC